ncbi:MAG: hypothetical protein AAF353_02215 [Pseudomonadota bacterium]
MIQALKGLLLISFLFGLIACEAEKDNARFNEQRYFFLEALKQVEAGGRQLQNGNLAQAEMTAALDNLDQGLKLAFEVQRPFLDEIDLRLGKNFERYFVKGVEHYRIGIEAADQEQQLAGLQLLQKWSQFWQAEQNLIMSRLNPE